MDLTNVEAQLLLINQDLKHLRKELESHTIQDAYNFTELHETISEINKNIDKLVISEVKRGERENYSNNIAKRYAVWAGIIATFLGGVIFPFIL